MFYRSTIGKKIIVALTGLVLFGFVGGHLLGNLQVFAGPQKINEYAEFLEHSPALLWGTRILLLISVAFHVICTIQLTARNKESRPISYAHTQVIAANLPSRFMMWSGIFLGAYIIFHLLHLTGGYFHPHFQAEDVYSNLIQGFSVWSVSLFYIAAMVALGFHLFHGLWSVFQTLGLNHEKYNCYRRVFAVVVSIAISLGYISIPVAILLGILH